MIIIIIAVLASVGSCLLRFIGQDEKWRKTSSLVLIGVVQFCLSIHYAAAYREISEVPKLGQGEMVAWMSGAGAMTHYTLTSYIPAFAVLLITTMLIAIKNSSTRNAPS